VKGRYGFDYVHHPQRLTKPLIRKPGVPKTPISRWIPANPLEYFREASWEEALELAAGGLREIRDRTASTRCAGFGSAKGTNEEAYLFQKLVRTGFGSNNVDHCTRLCHASSVAALLEGIGSARGVEPGQRRAARAEVIFLIGANPTPTTRWPPPGSRTRPARREAHLRRPAPLGSRATRRVHLQFKPDTDVALLNAMMHTIVDEGLVDEDFIRSRTSATTSCGRTSKATAPRRWRRYAAFRRDHPRSRAGLRDLEGLDDPLGHGHLAARARHRQRTLPDRAVPDDRPDRPSRHGAASAARQNNVQGASDSGLIPMVFPDYQRVDNPEARARFEKLWGAARPKPG
jgi:formate dehydrogenase major subunit